MNHSLCFIKVCQFDFDCFSVMIQDASMRAKKVLFKQQQNLGRIYGASKMRLRLLPVLNVLLIDCGSSVFVFGLLCITLCPF